MSMRQNWIHGIVVTLAVLGWVGCSGCSKPPADQAAHHEGDGHDHGEKGHSEGDGHDHGAKGHAEAGHEEGPHHGHLIELGEEEYHAELTHDEATKTVNVYLLDKTAKTAVPVAEPHLVLSIAMGGTPQDVQLAAAPQDGDPPGQSSRFTATDAKLLEALEGPKAAGRLHVTIAGKSYTGVIEHHEHGEHKHK